MAILRLCLSLGTASLLASKAAAANDEQSLVQRNINFHTSEADAAPGNLDVNDLVSSTFAFMSSAIKSSEYMYPYFPPSFQKTIALYQNASTEELAKFGAAFVLSYRDSAWVGTLYGGVTKLSNILSAFSTAVTKAATELSANADGANVTLTQSLLKVNTEQVNHAIAVAAGDQLGLVQHLFGSMPAGELYNMTMGYREYIKNVTVQDELEFVQGQLVNETHKIFASMDTLCRKLNRKTVGASVLAQGLRGSGDLAKAKDSLAGLAPAIYAFAPDVTFRFLLSANTTMDALNSSSYEVASALDEQVKALTSALMTNLGCTAPSKD